MFNYFISNFNVYFCSYLLGKKVNYLFPIQSETFDYIYNGEDVIAQASKFIIAIFSDVSIMIITESLVIPL